MKILLANKYYYARGGAEVYTIELEKLLQLHGHEVAFFSMQHPENLPSKFSKYFPTEIDYRKLNIGNLFKAFVRPFGSKEVKSAFTKILDDFKPDVVHLSNIHSQLSPSLAKIAYKKNIPVVWTLHDFKVLCPAYNCIRDGKTCELCYTNKMNVLKHKCVKGLKGSIIAYMEAKYWNRNKIEKFTAKYVAPSYFLKKKLEQCSYNENKIVACHNFIDKDKFIDKPTTKEKYYCYVGRLSHEKGIASLVEAASQLPEFNFKIIGTGPLGDDLKSKYNYPHIDFVGYKNWDELKVLLENAMFMVLPSECYENNPLCIIEAYSLGTPVLGSNVGGIPELITENLNGLLFEAGNIPDLKSKIIKMFQSEFDYQALIDDAKVRFSSELYYKNIIEIYEEVLN